MSQDGQDQFIVERLGGKRGGVFFEVEPSPTACALLRTNRSCIVVNACIAASPGVVRYLHIEGCAAMLSGIVSHYDARHLGRIDREMQPGGGEKRELDMPCHTIDGLARDNAISRIDYLSVDTEGGELEILESIDFSRLDVNLITVENNYGDPRLRTVLGRSGFRLIAKIARDEVYQHVRYLERGRNTPTRLETER
jgi:FkbM family methyltransferase